MLRDRASARASASSLTNRNRYGRLSNMASKNIHAVELGRLGGRIGGKASTPAKREAARKNGRKNKPKSAAHCPA